METQFPELKEKVATVRKELSASQVGQGFSGLTDALKKMTGDEFERYDQASRKQIRDLGAARKLDPKMTRIALENISKVKGGALPREILRTVIAMNPTYREAPGKMFDDGWIAGFSTKMDPVKRKVHFLLYYPGTMKPLQPAAKSDLFRAQSDEGYGNAILTLRVIDAPDPKYAKMAPLDLAKLLVPESANVIESKPAKLAGLPAGRVTFDLKTEGADVQLRHLSYAVHTKEKFVIVTLAIDPRGGVKVDAETQKYLPLMEKIAAKLEIE